jgi:hypothetical protein
LFFLNQGSPQKTTTTTPAAAATTTTATTTTTQGDKILDGYGVKLGTPTLRV